MHWTSAPSRALALSALMALGCNPLAYDDLATEAPIQTALPEESNDNANFGIVLSTYSVYNAYGVDPVDVSGMEPEGRVVTTNGPSSTWEIFGDDDASGLSFGRQMTVCPGIWAPDHILQEGEQRDDQCGSGTGAAVVGLPRYRVTIGGVQQYAYDCVLGTSTDLGNLNDDGRLRIKCESNTEITPVVEPPSSAGLDFGFALAPVPWDDPNTPFDDPGSTALIGAPGTDTGGSLFFFQDNRQVSQVELPSDLVIPTSARLGTSLATRRGPDTAELSDVLLVAVGAPGIQRVYLFAYGYGDAPLEPGTSIWQFRTVGCVDGVTTRAAFQSESLGTAISFGDVITGNSGPELLLVKDSGPQLGVFALEDFAGTENGCAALTTDDDPSPSGGWIACPEDAGEIECLPTNAFGASLAAGDLDADGDDDIIVGIPRASRGDSSLTGAVMVIPGNGSSAPDVAEAVWLTPSSNGAESRLGSQVGVMEVVDRSGVRRPQVVASSPGDQKLFLFMCSGLGDDVVPGCLPPT